MGWQYPTEGQGGQPLEFGDMRRRVFRLGNKGDRILDDIAGKQKAGVGQVQHDAVGAVDVKMHGFDATAADCERQPVVERFGWQHQRPDRRITVLEFVAGLQRALQA